MNENSNSNIDDVLDSANRSMVPASPVADVVGSFYRRLVDVYGMQQQGAWVLARNFLSDIHYSPSWNKGQPIGEPNSNE